jgi:hypothetical protein
VNPNFGSFNSSKAILSSLIIALLLVIIVRLAEAGKQVWTTNGPEGGNVQDLKIGPPVRLVPESLQFFGQRFVAISCYLFSG